MADPLVASLEFVPAGIDTFAQVLVERRPAVSAAAINSRFSASGRLASGFASASRRSASSSPSQMPASWAFAVTRRQHFLGQQRRPLRDLDQVAHSQKYYGRLPLHGTSADDATPRRRRRPSCACSIRNPARAATKLVIAPEVFGVLRLGRYEADEPVPALDRGQRQNSRLPAARSAAGSPTCTWKTPARWSATMDRPIRCAALSTNSRTASGSPSTASVASSSLRTSSGLRRVARNESGSASHAGVQLPAAVHVLDRVFAEVRLPPLSTPRRRSNVDAGTGRSPTLQSRLRFRRGPERGCPVCGGSRGPCSRGLRERRRPPGCRG